MKRFFRKKRKNNRGFTLVEALISVTILMISVVAPLNLAANGLIAADIAQRQIIAFYLAQDSIEWVINKKTDNKLASLNLLGSSGDNLYDRCIIDSPGDYGCSINTLDGSILKCLNPSCSSNGKLYKDGSGKYVPNPSSGSDSSFTRYIKITPISGLAPNYTEAKIEITIKWVSATGSTQSYILWSNITNW